MFKSTDYYKNVSIPDICEELGTVLDKGLDSLEVNKRLHDNGYNEIKTKEVPPWLKFLKKFWGPIPWIIEVAAILSYLAGKIDDLVIILILLFANVIVEWWQEHKAESVLAILKQKLETKTLVLRNGKWDEIPSRELVVGDIIRLRLGNVIPADVKLISGDYLRVDQSSLTGESLPVSKKVNDVAYANSVVKQGEMNAIVVNTAINTFFGQTAKSISTSSLKRESHYQKAVIKITDFLILLNVVLIAIVIIYALFKHDDFLDILRFLLALTVASIPVALPAVLTVTMAAGAINLAKKKAIVSKLTSIEELAGMDVLCSDKTGTLTKNQLKVSDMIAKKPYRKEDVIIYASLASKEENKDPIDLTILRNLSESKLETKLKGKKQLKFYPFDPIRKRTEALIKAGNKKFKVTKGAPQVILGLCPNITEDDRTKIFGLINDYANNGYRTIGVAINRNVTKDEWTWVGLIAISDPPRDDSKEVIEEARNYHVDVKMITGDNVAIAKQIASILGLGTNIRRASELTGKSNDEIILLGKIIAKALYTNLNKKHSEEEIKKFVDGVIKEINKEFKHTEIPPGYIKKHESQIVDLIESANGFAEVYPEHKSYIVQKLQEKDHIVGMTGDGVNDAPALSAADCGIAVSGATDAARAAADLVLLNPGLRVIIDAIKEARKIFQRMNTYVVYRIAETIRIMFFMTLAILFFNSYPITAFMVILLALFNDIPILSIASDRATVNESPQKWDFNLVLTMSFVLGTLGVMASFGIFYIGKVLLGLSAAALSTFVFLKLIVAGHLTIFNTRTLNKAFFRTRPSNILLISVISTALLAYIFSIFGILLTPLSKDLWKSFVLATGVVVYALSSFLLNDFFKIITYKWLEKIRVKDSQEK